MEEIDIKYEVVCEPENTKFSVNIKSICFLCLGDINYNNHDESLPENKPNQTEDTMSLLSICRYLKIDLRDIFNVATTSNKSKLLVNLCKVCRIITANLSDLCEQIELLQMKLDYNLGKFTGILENSEQDVVKLFQFQSLHSTDEKVAQFLRAQISKKCNTKLQGAQPRVLISDENQPPENLEISGIIQDDPQESITFYAPQPEYTSISPPSPPTQQIPEQSSSSKTSSNRFKCSDCSSTYQHKKSLIAHRRLNHLTRKPIQVEHTCPMCSCKFQQRSDYLKHKSFDCPFLPPGTSENGPPPDIAICTLCTPNKAVNLNNFRKHKFRNHIETFLSSHKQPDVTLEDFKIYCEHVFKVELLSYKRVWNSEDNLPQGECPHCQNRYTDHYSFRYHLYHGHKQIIIRKLEELQKSKCVEEIKGIILPNFSLYSKPSTNKHSKVAPNLETKAEGNSSYYFCDLCQPRRRVQLQLKARHVIHFHVETLFLASKTRRDLSDEDFKLYCEYLFHTEIQSCPRNTEMDENFKIKCGNCPKTFCEERALRRHFVREHKEVLNGKLVTLLEALGVEEVKGRLTEMGFEAMKEKVKGLPSRAGLSKTPFCKRCRFCEKDFSNKFNLKRHIKQVHGVDMEEMGEAENMDNKLDEGEGNEGQRDLFEDGGEFVTKVELVSSEISESYSDEEDEMGDEDGDGVFHYQVEDLIFEEIGEIEMSEVNDQEDFEMEIMNDQDPLQI